MTTAEWLPAATLAAGVIGTVGGQGLTAWLASKRDESARAAERDVSREAFQRDTLLDVQDAVYSLMRATSETHMHDQKAPYTLLPPDLDEQLRAGTANVGHLRQRILDDQLRAEVRQLIEAMTRVMLPNPDVLEQQRPALQQREWLSLMHAHQGFEDRLGAILRTLI
jgi:hypothetical protein